MFAYLGAAKKRAKAGVGPKQKACLAQGGTWEGPIGKKKCNYAAGAAPAAPAGGQLPAPGSTVQGPIPAEWAGSAAKTGAPGPKQAACLEKGGSWIGPDGKRWCQIPVGAVPAVAGAVVPKGLPSDSATVPHGAEVGGGGLPSIDGRSAATPEMQMAPGMQTAESGAPGPAYPLVAETSWFSGRNLAILAGVGIVGFFAFRKMKRGRKAGKRRAKR